MRDKTMNYNLTYRGELTNDAVQTGVGRDLESGELYEVIIDGTGEPGVLVKGESLLSKIQKIKVNKKIPTGIIRGPIKSREGAA